MFQVTNATTASDLNEVTSQSFVDALMAAGWVNPLTVANKDVAMWQLVVHETLLKRKTPLDHFTEGLKVLNLLKLMQSYPEQMSLYFTHTESSLNKEMVISLFNLHTEDHDEANERCSEYFIQAIGDLEEGKILDKILKVTNDLDVAWLGCWGGGEMGIVIIIIRYMDNEL